MPAPRSKGDPRAQVVEQWVSSYDGSGSGEDRANAVAVDAEGNIYVTGQVSQALGDLDLATIKYDPAGSEAWTRRYNGPVNSVDEPSRIVVDGSGNVYVTGTIA